MRASPTSTRRRSGRRFTFHSAGQRRPATDIARAESARSTFIPSGSRSTWIIRTACRRHRSIGQSRGWYSALRDPQARRGLASEEVCSCRYAKTSVKKNACSEEQAFSVHQLLEGVLQPQSDAAASFIGTSHVQEGRTQRVSIH